MGTMSGGATAMRSPPSVSCVRLANTRALSRVRASATRLVADRSSLRLIRFSRTSALTQCISRPASS